MCSIVYLAGFFQMSVKHYSLYSRSGRNAIKWETYCLI